MTTEDWWALVEQNPDDAETREAFAVWLIDEANDPTGADGVRWIVRADRRPSPNVALWFWWEADENTAGADSLPEPVFRLLEGDRAAACVAFPTRRAAEEALLDAFRIAVATGWQPED
jgi:hypothetical protein